MSVPRFYPLLVERELKRIGVNRAKLGGLAASGLDPTAFLAWLRTIPGHSGHAKFMARLRAPADKGGPHAPGPDEGEAPDVATFRDEDSDFQLAFVSEWERIAPTGSATEDSYGFNLPRDRSDALARLRAVPTGAGIEAFLRALELPDSRGA
jgi:hypothetical protein